MFFIFFQLQVITSDEMSKKLLQLYYYEKSRTHGQIVDHVYYENAHVIAHDGALYRLESVSSYALFFQKNKYTHIHTHLDDI